MTSPVGVREMLRPLQGVTEGVHMSTPVWGGPESYIDDAYPPSLLKHLLKPMMAQFAAHGACIALFDEKLGQMRVRLHVRVRHVQVQGEQNGWYGGKSPVRRGTVR